MKKSFIITINVPDDFKPGQCKECPYVSNFGDMFKEWCALDPNDRNCLCGLKEIE